MQKKNMNMFDSYIETKLKNGYSHKFIKFYNKKKIYLRTNYTK